MKNSDYRVLEYISAFVVLIGVYLESMNVVALGSICFLSIILKMYLTERKLIKLNATVVNKKEKKIIDLTNERISYEYEINYNFQGVYFEKTISFNSKCNKKNIFIYIFENEPRKILLKKGNYIYDFFTLLFVVLLRFVIFR